MLYRAKPKEREETTPWYENLYFLLYSNLCGGRLAGTPLACNASRLRLTLDITRS